MKRTSERFVCTSAVLLLLVSLAAAKSKFPQPQGMVSDFAGKLSTTTKKEIETTLLSFQERSQIEFVVVTIMQDELLGRPIEQYSLQMAREWGIGGGPQKLGLLLLVAISKPDNQGLYRGATRLEVSRNLERDMPN